jgi:hypothetical protein
MQRGACPTGLFRARLFGWRQVDGAVTNGHGTGPRKRAAFGRPFLFAAECLPASLDRTGEMPIFKIVSPLSEE